MDSERYGPVGRHAPSFYDYDLSHIKKDEDDNLWNLSVGA
jgi:hypothetical protein